MPASGRPYQREKAAFRAECKARNAACWLCQGTRGPIDYDTTNYTDPLAFTVDHVTATSNGGDKMRRSNWAPAHYGCNSARGNGSRGQFPTTRRW